LKACILNGFHSLGVKVELNQKMKYRGKLDFFIWNR
jgi:hypothetical protein